MPPKRRVPNRIPVEEANERDRVAQLEQQMAQITEQLATLLANQNPNQNPFQALNPNGGDVEDESDEEESDPSLFYDETCLSEEVFSARYRRRSLHNICRARLGLSGNIL